MIQITTISRPSPPPPIFGFGSDGSNRISEKDSLGIECDKKSSYNWIIRIRSILMDPDFQMIWILTPSRISVSTLNSEQRPSKVRRSSMIRSYGTSFLKSFPFSIALRSQRFSGFSEYPPAFHSDNEWIF